MSKLEKLKLELATSHIRRSRIFQHVIPLLGKIGIIMLPFYILIGLNAFGLFSRDISEAILQISAILIFLLGLPLSAGLRIDQLSLELGGTYSREVILLIASIITCLNLLLILGFRAWLKIPPNKS